MSVRACVGAGVCCCANACVHALLKKRKGGKMENIKKSTRLITNTDITYVSLPKLSLPCCAGSLVAASGGRVTLDEEHPMSLASLVIRHCTSQSANN